MGIARRARHPAVWLPISIGLLLFVAWRSHLWDALHTLEVVDPGALVLALAINAVIPLLWAARSSDLLGGADRPVAIPPLVPMTMFANMINNLTPGSAGEVLRVWLLRAYHAVDYATGTAVVAIERLAAFWYLGGSAVIAWLGYVGGWPTALVVALLVLLVAAPGIAYGIGLRPSAIVSALPFGRVVGHRRWARGTTWLRGVDDTMARLLGHPVRLAVFAILTLGVFAGYTAQLVLVGRAIGVALDPLPAWGALGIAITAGVLSLLPFGLGSSDLVLVALLGVTGVDPAAAAAIALGYRLVSTLPLGVGGVASYAWLSARLPAGGTAAILESVRERPEGGLQ